jgi:hypothetical protein
MNFEYLVNKNEDSSIEVIVNAVDIRGKKKEVTKVVIKSKDDSGEDITYSETQINNISIDIKVKRPLFKDENNSPDYDLWHLVAKADIFGNELCLVAIYNGLDIVGTKCYPYPEKVDENQFLIDLSYLLSDKYRSINKIENFDV